MVKFTVWAKGTFEVRAKTYEEARKKANAWLDKRMKYQRHADFYVERCVNELENAGR